MQLGIVKGQVVSTKKADRLNGIKILVVQPLDIVTFRESGRPVASFDTVGAGEGEVVMLVNGSSARMTDTMSDKPTDSTIVAIIDSVDIRGTRVFDKAGGDCAQQEKVEPGKPERPVQEESAPPRETPKEGNPPKQKETAPEEVEEPQEAAGKPEITGKKVIPPAPTRVQKYGGKRSKRKK